MEIIPFYLTPVEAKAVKLLSEGQNYRIVGRVCSIEPQKLPAFLALLRKKTGIPDSKEPQYSLHFLRKYALSQAEPPPADALKTLRRVLGIAETPHTFEALGYKRGTNVHEAIAAYKAALHTIGIFSTDERVQRVQARVYFATQAPPVDASATRPFTPKRIKALELYAAGASFQAIADELPVLKPEYAKAIVKEGCEALGVKARGRGVQRRLVGVALERMKRENTPKEPPTMADPAF